eukprot:2354460-Rhodomonas_salina.1
MSGRQARGPRRGSVRGAELRGGSVWGAGGAEGRGAQAARAVLGGVCYEPVSWVCTYAAWYAPSDCYAPAPRPFASAMLLRCLLCLFALLPLRACYAPSGAERACGGSRRASRWRRRGRR